MVEIRYKDYLNKVYGGWLGKCIGGTAGAKQENNKSVMGYTFDTVFPETIPPNDDFDLQVLYLQEVLEKVGAKFSSNDLAKAFAQYNLCLANEYTFAIKNIELGIFPPLSGTFNNDFFKDSMGAPIRSEIWAFMSPGDPEAAVKLAALDGIIDHESNSEGVYGEQFLAAMESYAFVESDMHKIILKGLDYIPKNSHLFQCIDVVLAQCGKCKDWKVIREKIIREFGSADASDSVVNIGLIVMALVLGKRDFGKTVLMVINSGYDTDCTAATVGAVFGILEGFDKIPGNWALPIGDEYELGTVDIKRYSNQLCTLAEDTCKAGLSFQRDGLIDVLFTHVPDSVAPSLPLPGPDNSIEISMEYQDLPSIGYAQETCVTVMIKNNTLKDQDGTLSVKVPIGIICNLSDREVQLSANSTLKIDLNLSVLANASVLHEKNIIEVAFLTNTGEVFTGSFGLAGAKRMKVLGPYWDNYDSSVYTSDPYNSLMQRKPDGTHDLKAMFNCFVNLEQQYIDESFISVDNEPGGYQNFHKDMITLDHAVKYRGPYCVYLLYDFISPEERNDVILRIGNNIPFKFWLNNTVVCCDDSQTIWMPFNNSAGGIKLKAGKNRAIIKLIRSSECVKFSFHMTSKQNKHHWLTDLSSVIETAYYIPSPQ